LYCSYCIVDDVNSATIGDTLKPTNTCIDKDGEIHPTADETTTGASAIVVGDSNVSDSDEQLEAWVCLDRVTLNLNDKAVLLDGHCLTDKHISFAQALMKKQFPSINGLKSTLVAERHGKVLPPNGLQILLVRGNHWILLSTMQCSEDSVKVYDSAFHSHPKAVLLSIVKALVRDEETIRVSIMDTEMQPTPNDCGIYAIAMMVTIAYGSEPCFSKYQHSGMRDHLSQCFEDNFLVPFSSSPSVKSKAERTCLTFSI